MVGYEFLAQQYDNYFYDDYIQKIRKKYLYLLKKHCKNGGYILDAGCGTGMMTIFLKENGYTLDGVDISEQMLAKAKEKDSTVKFYCHDITNKLPNNTYDAVVSCLDVVNHIVEPSGVIRFFDNALQSLADDGVLLFDVNKYKKFSRQYANNRYVYSGKQTFCVWDNCFDPETELCNFSLTVYSKTEDKYIGKHDSFSERHYSDSFIVKSLKQSGFRRIESVTVDKGTRAIYIAKK